MSKAKEFLKKYQKKGYETRDCISCYGKGIVHYTCHQCKGEGIIVDFCEFVLQEPNFHRHQCLLPNGHKRNHKFSKELI